MQEYSSKKKKKKKTQKSKKAETGGFELTLLAPRIERYTAEPKENVVNIYRVREADFQKSSLAEFGGDARSFTGDREVGGPRHARAVFGGALALGSGRC